MLLKINNCECYKCLKFLEQLMIVTNKKKVDVINDTKQLIMNGILGINARFCNQTCTGRLRGVGNNFEVEWPLKRVFNLEEVSP